MVILHQFWKPAVLFAVIAFAITGCGGRDAVAPIELRQQAFEDLRGEIRAAIDDPAREAEAITMVDALVEDFNKLRERTLDRRRRARQLNADYDTTRAEFEALFDLVDKDIQANKRQVSERQRALFAITTPDERSAIAKAHTRAMDAAIRHIQTI